MARTTAQIDIEIAEVAAAITGILTGAQSTTAGDGRRLDRASLADLRQLKTDLIAERDALERRDRKQKEGSVMVGRV